ncbi:YtxH domain-containing protein [Pedobacter sp. ASV28]|uniref:YtxH domain-containing protein n=1 Tax=Pedobacter sp. ASV28 TaxID=2795123 RepID=UPI0018EB4330|nr:YtxH domain-containing protein [Pedobacter sp. ASV28]
MGFIKNALIGIAVYQVIKYLTKQDEFGRTKIEELKDRVPEWIEKAKKMKEDIQKGVV